MKFRKLTATAAALAVAGTLAVGSTANAQEATTTTLVDVLDDGDVTDRNWYDYDILFQGVVAAGLAEALSAAGDKTVFIPNDRAFQALAADLFGWRVWFEKEEQVLARIAGLGADTLKTVILYHVVPGANINSAAALDVSRGTPLTTALAVESQRDLPAEEQTDFESFRVFPIKRFGTAILADNDRNDANPFLVRSQLDIKADNGIAHGIGFVLRPFDLDPR